jgi:hypothetical protein
VIGCSEPITATEVFGRYFLRKPGATVELDLNRDMTYLETIRFDSGQNVAITGKWFFVAADGSVSLNGAAELAIPLYPEHIRRIDTGMEGMRWWFGRMHLTAYVDTYGDHDFVRDNQK